MVLRDRPKPRLRVPKLSRNLSKTAEFNSIFNERKRRINPLSSWNRKRDYRTKKLKSTQMRVLRKIPVSNNSCAPFYLWFLVERVRIWTERRRPHDYVIGAKKVIPNVAVEYVRKSSKREEPARNENLSVWNVTTLKRRFGFKIQNHFVFQTLKSIAFTANSTPDLYWNPLKCTSPFTWRCNIHKRGLDQNWKPPPLQLFRYTKNLWFMTCITRCNTFYNNVHVLDSIV